MSERKEKKVVDYRIVYGDTVWDLEALVRDIISKGFEPTGGVCLGKIGGLYQAMVKKEVPFDYPIR